MRRFFGAASFLFLSVASTIAVAQPPEVPERVTEPVYRISKNESAAGAVIPEHKLDPALRMARESLTTIRERINDYTAVLVKREQINGKLGEYEYMFCKIRNRKMDGNKIAVPFSVYLAFLKPSSVRGREVLFVENQNDGNIVAHEGGFKGRFLPTVRLNPTSSLAMSGQRYPLTDIGIENLVVKLIERGERDRSNGPCEVQFIKGAKVQDRPCTVLQVTHNEFKEHYDFHIAQVFIDDEYGMPIRYAAYGWPTAEGEKPEVIEEYTYQNIKVNVGLTDKDFDPHHDDYKFYSK